MFPGYKAITNYHAAKSLLKTPDRPGAALAVGDDEYHASIPLVIFANQHQPAQRPIIQDVNSMPYEKTAVKGAGDTLSMDAFVSDDFNIGKAFGSI